jgi:hippurate hydrolase
VLTFGRFHAGTAPNVIPTEAQLAGTLRTFDEGWRSQAKALISRIVKQTAAAWELQEELAFLPGYPVLYNDPELTNLTRAWCAELLGDPALHALPLWMSSEDFAFYSHRVPVCFLRLGTGNDTYSPSRRPVHTPDFDIAEEALPLGTAILSFIALKALEHFRKS